MRTRYQSEWVKKKTGEEKKEKKTYLNKLATRSTSSATHIFHSYLINKTKREEEEEDGEGERKKLSAPYDGAVLECSAYCCLHSKHSDRTVNMEFSFFFFYTSSHSQCSSSLARSLTLNRAFALYIVGLLVFNFIALFLYFSLAYFTSVC